MPDGRTIHCEVLTPDGHRYVADARMVVFPAADGLVGILPGRAPLVAALGAGMLTITAPGGEKDEYYLARGFAQVHEDTMTILADECVPVGEINPEQAWDEIESARAMTQETPGAAARRGRLLDAARIKFRLAQRYRSRLRRQRGEAARADGDLDFD